MNNRYAVDALQESLGLTGMLFEGEYRFTKKFAYVINEASKTTQFGLFNFRAVLNIGMLLTESESK